MRNVLLPVATLVVGWLLAQITEVLRDRRDEAAREAERRVEHERWIRERRAEAYLDYLEVLHHLSDWLNRRFQGYDDQLDDPYDDRSLTRMECRVQLYGSEHVRSLITGLWPLVSESLTTAVIDRDVEAGRQVFEGVKALRSEIDAAMAAEVQAVIALRHDDV